MRSWDVKELNEVCQIRPPKNEAKQKLTETDLVSFIPMRNLGIAAKSIYLDENRQLGEVSGSYTYFADNDVLLAKITPCFENGKLGIARNLTNGIGFGSSEYIVFRSKGSLMPEYLFYFLSRNSFRTAGARVMTGSVGHKRVPKEFIANCLIPVPSLSEQKRIVAILDEVFAGIDDAIANTEKNLTNARELFESYLNAIFTCDVDGWKEKTLQEILAVQPRNGWSPPAKNHSDVGTPVLTLSSVTGFHFNQHKRKFTSATTREDAHYWLEDGEFLMTRSNTPALVGHVAICKDLAEPTICCDLIMKMKIDSEQAETRFIYWYFRTRLIRELITNSAQGANPTMKKINKGIVQNFPVAFPEIPIQKAIINKVDAFAIETQRLETIYQQKLTALNELKQSILQKAFTGELTADTASQTKKAKEAIAV